MNGEHRSGDNPGAAWRRALPGGSLAAHSDEPVLFGSGFPSALNTATNAAGVTGPWRGDLDAVVSDRPVLILALDAHSAWLNSATARRRQFTGCGRGAAGRGKQ